MSWYIALFVVPCFFQLCLWLCDKGNLQEVAYRPLLAAIDPPVNEEENFSEVVDSVYYRNGQRVTHTMCPTPYNHYAQVKVPVCEQTAMQQYGKGQQTWMEMPASQSIGQ